MKSRVSLLRKESFGGTLSNAVSGKRIYINRNEFDEIERTRLIPSYLCAELQTPTPEVIIRVPSQLPPHNFSAPDVVFFELTRACNLTCKHCFNSSGERLTLELSDKQRSTVLTDLSGSGVQEIRFTGGEPLVMPGVFDHIMQIRHLGLRATIGTNGVLITSRIAQRLVNAGLNAVITSIDGMEHQHDEIRGPGTFQKVIRGIQALLDAGIAVRVNIVAMKSNVGDLPNVVKYFYEREIPVMIRRFIPSGRAVR